MQAWQTQHLEAGLLASHYSLQSQYLPAWAFSWYAIHRYPMLWTCLLIVGTRLFSLAMTKGACLS